MALNDNEIRKDPNYIFSLERNLRQYMFVLLIGMFAVIILLLIALTALIPLKEKQPYLVFFSDPQTNFVRVEPANYDIRADEALLKSIIASYVKNREMINRVNDIERYEEIRIQSSNNVWRLFNALVTQNNSIYTTKGIYRDIKIINTSILSNKVATVDFIATIMSEATANKEYKRYRATLSYEFSDQDINFDSLPKNPTGFMVNEYALTEVDIRSTQENKTKAKK